MGKARIAQIGIGGYGASIRRALVNIDNAELVAVCDTNEELVGQVAQETGAEALDADSIFAADHIDAVALVLPNTLHRRFCERAAKARKHVFVEKPIANDSADGYAMIAACREAGVRLMIGHNYRRQQGYRQMKQWVEEEAIGTIIDAQAENSHAGGLSLNPATWRFDPAQCPALPLFQLGVHGIDVCNHLFGRPVEVTALQRHRVIPGDNVDATMTLIAYESDILVSLASHYVTPHRTEILLSGVGGRIWADRSKATLFRGGKSESPELIDIDSQAEEMREFAAAVMDPDIAIETPGEVGLWAQAVCEAAVLSARERRTVELDELEGVRALTE